MAFRVAVALGVLAVVWALALLGTERIGFAATVPPRLRGAEEAASALAHLFGALVLCLYPSDEGAARRLRWVVAGLVVLEVGHLFYAYLAPLSGAPAGPDESLLAGLLVRTLAGALFVAGLTPSAPPRFSRLAALAVALAACAAWSALELAQMWGVLPAMVGAGGVGSLAGEGEAPPGLTGWHWAFSSVPLALAVAAAVGAFRRVRDGELGGWLLVAMALLAASQLHGTFWPSPYGSPVLTSANLLRLAFAGAVAAGGALELRKIAADRAALLAGERRRVRTLEELSEMKADFTAMVAHELASPLLAVRSFVELLAGEDLGPEERARVLGGLHEQADGLGTLVEDVRTSAAAERDGFSLAPRPVPVAGLLSSAASYAEALPGGHRLSVSDDTGGARVLADPGRVGQVLRNLLSNAAKYSPAGSEVTLRAEGGGHGAGPPLRLG